MGQRLGIAAALLGDPQTLILDEPVNGLDPEGVLWVRNLVRYLASQGKTVFLSSHLYVARLAQTADHLIVIGRGRIIADAPVRDIIAGTRPEPKRWSGPAIRTSSRLLAGDGVSVEQRRTKPQVTGLDPRRSRTAPGHQVLVYELTLQATLEDAYFDLTKDEVEYHSLITTGDHAPVPSGGD